MSGFRYFCHAFIQIIQSLSMKRILYTLTLLLCGATALFAQTNTKLVDYVNPLMGTQPHLVAGLLVGTVLGVALFKGVPVGPLIAAGLLSMIVGKT